MLHEIAIAELIESCSGTYHNAAMVCRVYIDGSICLIEVACFFLKAVLIDSPCVGRWGVYLYHSGAG